MQSLKEIHFGDKITFSSIKSPRELPFLFRNWGFICSCLGCLSDLREVCNRFTKIASYLLSFYDIFNLYFQTSRVSKAKKYSTMCGLQFAFTGTETPDLIKSGNRLAMCS
jgi:hypothetical protein